MSLISARKSKSQQIYFRKVKNRLPFFSFVDFSKHSLGKAKTIMQIITSIGHFLTIFIE